MLASKTYLLVCCYHKLIRKAIPVIPKQPPKYGDLALTSLIIEAQQHDSTVRVVLPVYPLAEVLVVRDQNPPFSVSSADHLGIGYAWRLVKHREGIMPFVLQPMGHRWSRTLVHNKSHSLRSL